MRISVNGRNFEVTDQIRRYAKKKTQKLDRYFQGEPELQAMVSCERGRFIVEMTLHAAGLLLRAEVRSSDLHAGVDEAVARLEAQMQKHRTRLSRRQSKNGAQFTFEAQQAAAEQMPEEPEGKIVRVKRFALKPMDVEEAVLQMELLGHSFFVFTEASTGKVNVIYRRSDGDYGLLEPEY